MEGKLRCPSCDEANDPDNTYCRRCGSPVGDVPVRFEPAPGDDEDLGGTGNPYEATGSSRGLLARLMGARVRTLRIVAASLGSVAVIGVLVANADWLSEDPPPPPLPTVIASPPVLAPSSSSPSPAPVQPSVEPTRLDRAEITATATSTLAAGEDLRYDAEVTLDGDPETAWNDGVPDDVGIGESLTYRFAEPVRLASLEIRNGYDKERDGRDSWGANARVEDLTVATDTMSVAVTLTDVREPQAVDVPDEVTCAVVLTVDSVHPGESFTDVAISEVEFIGTLVAGTCDG